ncbi:copper resistance CopC family protein [Nocardia nova]|uniref:copper resistance CopC family protein n=1 Tax=Nocardia nova TaxID=37330 RepID=UPI002157D1A4|nr:copper resistance protein CopC [Nocardia nova]
MWSAGAASAHAVLASTDPGPGAHVDTSPAELRLQLDEPVTLVAESAQLIDSGGKRFALSGTRLDDGQRRVVLVPAAPVPDGAYLATARVVSADTHVVSLSIQFTVGTVTAPGHFADRSSPGIEHYLDSPTRGLTYLGLILSAGLYAAACWVRPSVVRRRRFQVVYRVGNAVFSAGFVFRFSFWSRSSPVVRPISRARAHALSSTARTGRWPQSRCSPRLLLSRSSPVAAAVPWRPAYYKQSQRFSR